MHCDPHGASGWRPQSLFSARYLVTVSVGPSRSNGRMGRLNKLRSSSTNLRPPIGSPTNRKGGCGTGADRPKPRLCGPRDQAIQNGLEASKSAVQRDIPISCKHRSSRLCNSWSEQAECHHAVISCLTSLQCRPLRGCSARWNLIFVIAPSIPENIVLHAAPFSVCNQIRT
jgi:hypothetical protein